MTQRLDSQSNDILHFRPIIDFVQPKQEPFPITPVIPPDNIQPDTIDDQRRQIKSFADALNILAAAVQSRIDDKCKDMVIKLDPDVDAAVIQAMRRQFPEAIARTELSIPTSNQATSDPNAINKSDGFFITYPQYKICRDNIRDSACETAANVLPKKDAIAKARQDIIAGNVNVGGVGTPEASNGGLRPELYGPGQVIKPLKMDEFQNLLIKILVNFIWKNFLKPILIIVLPAGAGLLLPDELAKLPEGFSLPDIVPKPPKI